MTNLLKRDPYEPGDYVLFGPFTTHEGITIIPQPDTGIRLNSRREAVIANAAHNAAHEAKKEAEREAKIELFLRQEVAVEDATPSPYKSASTNAKGDGR